MNWTKTASPNAIPRCNTALRVELAETARFPLHARCGENICGTPKDAFLKVCEYIAEPVLTIKLPRSCMPSAGRNTRWCAKHSYDGDDPAAARQYGMAGGGVNALRGHSNIQGLTDWGYCRRVCQVT